MRMYVMLFAAIVLVAVLLFVLDRALKALARGRRRRQAAIRLTAAAAQAASEARQQAAVQHVSGALTTVLPAIKQPHEGPRRVA